MFAPFMYQVAALTSRHLFIFGCLAVSRPPLDAYILHHDFLNRYFKHDITHENVNKNKLLTQKPFLQLAFLLHSYGLLQH